MRTRVLGGLVAALLVIAALGLVHYRYGSLANAAAYLEGHSVTADHTVHELGSVNCGKPFEVRFNLTNLQHKPLRIVGANASCSCILPPEMPVTLESFAATPVTFTIMCSSKPATFEEEIELYFDGPLPAMTLRISGVSR